MCRFFGVCGFETMSRFVNLASDFGFTSIKIYTETGWFEHTDSHVIQIVLHCTSHVYDHPVFWRMLSKRGFLYITESICEEIAPLTDGRIAGWKLDLGCGKQLLHAFKLATMKDDFIKKIKEEDNFLS